MDLSFLWTWLTPAEWDAAIRAALTGVGVAEVMKRGAKLAGKDLSNFALWVLSIGVTAIAAALYTLRASNVASLDALTLSQWIDLVLFAVLVGPFAPAAHWLVLLKGADFLSWIIEKRTGYQVNLRELASGSSYQFKRVRKRDGTVDVRPIETPSGPGEVTLPPTRPGVSDRGGSDPETPA